MLAGLPGREGGDLLVGLDHGDDAAVVRIDGDRAVIATADFFTPVVDDPYDWGRIAAANALSDVYAMGGEPLVAVNLLAWPRDRIPFELAARGAARRRRRLRARPAATSPAGTASTTRSRSTAWPSPASPTPTGCCATTPASPGTPLTLTKPLGLGVLNNRHKATGERFAEAVAVMTHAQPGRLARRARRRGPLRHRRHRLRAARPPAQAGPGQRGLRGGRRRRGAVPRRRARSRWPTATSPAAAAATSTGCGRTSTSAVDEDELLLLADAQTSGGLLVAGELPGTR